MVLASTTLATGLAAAPVAVGQAAPAGADTAAKASTYPTKMKCYGDQAQYCIRINKRLKTRFKPTWSGVVENRTSRWIRGAQCKSTISKTTKWGLSTSLSAELKAGVFASINATISGSVEKSMTSQIEFSVPFDVPPHTNTSCTQGFVVYRWQGLYFDRIRSSSYTYTIKAPRRVSWRIKDIK